MATFSNNYSKPLVKKHTMLHYGQLNKGQKREETTSALHHIVTVLTCEHYSIPAFDILDHTKK
jgi:hypothetical protein